MGSETGQPEIAAQARVNSTYSRLRGRDGNRQAIHCGSYRLTKRGWVRTDGPHVDYELFTV